MAKFNYNQFPARNSKVSKNIQHLSSQSSKNTNKAHVSQQNLIKNTKDFKVEGNLWKLNYEKCETSKRRSGK